MSKTTKYSELCCDTGSIFIGDCSYIDMIIGKVGKDGCFEDYKYSKQLFDDSKSSDACPVKELSSEDGNTGIGLLLGNANGNNIPIKIVRKYTKDKNIPLGIDIKITIIEYNE
jgi:hypothetical protein